jgi:transposase
MEISRWQARVSLRRTGAATGTPSPRSPSQRDRGISRFTDFQHPSGAHSKLPYDRKRYRGRNRVERFFNKLKQFRRLATRYDKLRATFFAAVCLVAAFLIVLIREHNLEGELRSTKYTKRERIAASPDGA